MRMSIVMLALVLPTAAFADVGGPRGGSAGFRYVYPASAGRDSVTKLYRDDLAALRDETAALRRADGGILTQDHRAYIATRQAALDRRYAEAMAN